MLNLHFLPRAMSSVIVFAILTLFSHGRAQAQCGELIVNGDFEAGNTGFSSQYIYTPLPPSPPQPVLDAGRYDVIADPSLAHPCFGGVDHSSGSGKSMIVNGATVPNVIVWEQTVSVLPSTNYRLSAWITSHCFAISPALLSFRVNGVQVGAVFQAPTTAFDWEEFSDIWFSDVNTSATISIVNMNTAGSGNDFGLDDISFRKIDETAPVIIASGPFTMWPPDHEYHTFTLSQLIASVTDDCDPSPSVVISGAGSDEPENSNGLGDGNTWDDIVISEDCQSIQLRAERNGNGNGRVYTVYVTATDASGNSSTIECNVSVPHNVRSVAVNDGVGAGYIVSGPCGMYKQTATASTPMQFTLEQNFPNPFNPSTDIRFTVFEATHVRLSVVDHLGRLQQELVNDHVSAGVHTVSFNAATLRSGMYFYRLDTPHGSKTMKMLLLK
jgi:hypothetical protein